MSFFSGVCRRFKKRIKKLFLPSTHVRIPSSGEELLICRDFELVDLLRTNGKRGVCTVMRTAKKQKIDVATSKTSRNKNARAKKRIFSPASPRIEASDSIFPTSPPRTGLCGRSQPSRGRPASPFPQQRPFSFFLFLCRSTDGPWKFALRKKTEPFFLSFRLLCFPSLSLAQGGMRVLCNRRGGTQQLSPLPRLAVNFLKRKRALKKMKTLLWKKGK